MKITYITYRTNPDDFARIGGAKPRRVSRIYDPESAWNREMVADGRALEEREAPKRKGVQQ